MGTRQMTPEEREGKAVCVDCDHCFTEDYYEDRPCGGKYKEYYCRLHVPPDLYNFITGEVNIGSTPNSALCRAYNSEGNCPDFR